MPIFKSTPTEPTLEERFASASATTAAALSVFEEAARDLEDAARQHDAVRQAAEDAVTYHDALAKDASAAVTQALAQAASIRTVIGG